MKHQLYSMISKYNDNLITKDLEVWSYFDLT